MHSIMSIFHALTQPYHSSELGGTTTAYAQSTISHLSNSLLWGFFVYKDLDLLLWEHVGENYGIDEDGLHSDVGVPEVGLSLDSDQYTNLQQLVDPLKESNNYGINVYGNTAVLNKCCSMCSWYSVFSQQNQSDNMIIIIW